MKKVYVVMQHNLPVAVFSTSSGARDFVAVQPSNISGHGIHWHIHSFVLDMMEDAPDLEQ